MDIKTFRIDDATYQRIVALAEKSGRSVASLIRTAILQYLKRRKA